MLAMVDPRQAREPVSRGEVEVLDAPEPGDGRGRHIAGARLVLRSQLRSNPKRVLLRDRVVFVCAAGVRSQSAARIPSGDGLGRVGGS
jgi:rhodanese-related sulfurtransferase